VPEGESLYHRYPDYRVTLEPNPARVRVCFAGEVVADSTRSLIVHETEHDDVVYLPREDVRMERLERSDHSTHCPFKGDASYWTIRTGGETAENAVWSYEDPFDEVAGLRGYLAFRRDRTELVRGE